MHAYTVYVLPTFMEIKCTHQCIHQSHKHAAHTAYPVQDLLVHAHLTAAYWHGYVACTVYNIRYASCTHVQYTIHAIRYALRTAHCSLLAVQTSLCVNGYGSGCGVAPYKAGMVFLRRTRDGSLWLFFESFGGPRSYPDTEAFCK